MLQSSCQKIITLLLLLAFTSQTLVAAAMTCELEEAAKMPALNTLVKSVAHHDMDHMQHDMSAMSAASDNSEHNHPSDCCKTMGHCVFGGCSLAAASTSIDFLLTPLNSAVEDFYSDVAPTPLASSPYRPPISC